MNFSPVSAACAKNMKAAPSEKISSISQTSEFTPEQETKLGEWLCAENLPPKTAQARCRQEWRLNVSLKILKKFCSEQQARRNRQDLDQRREETNRLLKTLTADPAATYRKLIQAAGEIAFERAHKEEKSAADLVVIREFLKLLTAARREDRENDKFLLLREKWEFDVARRCADHHEELSRIFADPLLDEDARLQTIRRRLFGENAPD
jgi:hypothetical protein